MPIIFVSGIPNEYPTEKLEEFWKELREAVKSNPDLKLRPDQVSIFFPTDMLQKGLGDEIIIFVQGLFDYAFRTIPVMNEYAEALGKITKFYFPDSLVECFVHSFRNTEQGFWSAT